MGHRRESPLRAAFFLTGAAFVSSGFFLLATWAGLMWVGFALMICSIADKANEIGKLKSQIRDQQNELQQKEQNNV